MSENVEQSNLENEDEGREGLEKRIKKALEVAIHYGQTDGVHHKAWVIDQMVRALAGDQYEKIVAESRAGEEVPESYNWDEGIAP